jgi:hypothetical protein
MSRGEVPEDAFTAEARARLVPGVRDFLIPYLRSLGEPSAFALVEEKTSGTTRRRVYRATHGSKSVRWTFELDPEGKISSFGPTAE